MQQQSALLALPAELRNNIYELIMLKDEDIDVKGAIGGHPARPPALLQASQQLRREATPMYYGRNTFVITPREVISGDIVDDDALCAWLSTLDAHARSCLRTVRLGTDDFFCASPAGGDKRRLACRRKLSEGQVQIDGAKLVVRVFDIELLGNETNGRVWRSG